MRFTDNRTLLFLAADMNETGFSNATPGTVP